MPCTERLLHPFSLYMLYNHDYLHPFFFFLLVQSGMYVAIVTGSIRTLIAFMKGVKSMIVQSGLETPQNHLTFSPWRSIACMFTISIFVISVLYVVPKCGATAVDQLLRCGTD